MIVERQCPGDSPPNRHRDRNQTPNALGFVQRPAADGSWNIANILKAERPVADDTRPAVKDDLLVGGRKSDCCRDTPRVRVGFPSPDGTGLRVVQVAR